MKQKNKKQQKSRLVSVLSLIHIHTSALQTHMKLDPQ